MQEGSKVSQKRHTVKKVRSWPQGTPVGDKFLLAETDAQEQQCLKEKSGNHSLIGSRAAPTYRSGLAHMLPSKLFTVRGRGSPSCSSTSKLLQHIVSRVHTCTLLRCHYWVHVSFLLSTLVDFSQPACFLHHVTCLRHFHACLIPLGCSPWWCNISLPSSPQSTRAHADTHTHTHTHTHTRTHIFSNVNLLPPSTMIYSAVPFAKKKNKTKLRTLNETPLVSHPQTL